MTPDPTIVVTGLVGLAALVWQLIDLLREARALPATKSAVLTQLSAWAAGIAAVFLFSASQFGRTVTIGGITLDNMDTPTKILVGLAVSSVASSVVDWKQARDNTDSSAKPPLVRSGLAASSSVVDEHVATHHRRADGPPSGR